MARCARMQHALLFALLPSLALATATSGCMNDCGVSNRRQRGRCSYDVLTEQPMCQCNDPFAGKAIDCSERVCPSEIAWFDRPVAKDTAHTTIAQCSNRGSCNRRRGLCTCDQDFEGSACDRSRCPASDQGTCSGHGRCVTLRKAGLLVTPEPAFYDEWDADKIQGCLCDPGYAGYDCTERVCPLGGDPLSTGPVEIQALTTSLSYRPEVQTFSATGTATAGGTGAGGTADVDEVQTIVIQSTNSPAEGTFDLQLDCTVGCALWPDSRRVVQTTAPITVNPTTASSTAASVRAALEGLPMIGAGQLTVTASIVTVAANVFQHIIVVTFSGPLVAGRLNTLSVITTTGLIAVGPPTGAVSAPLITVTTPGSEVTGSVTLSWDYAASRPTTGDYVACGDTDDAATITAYAGVATLAAPLSVTASESQIQTALQSILFSTGAVAHETPIATGAIVVSKVTSHGPGVTWQVTFAAGVRTRGDVAPLTVVSSAVSLLPNPALTGAAAAAPTVVETTKGGFLAGTISPQIRYKTDLQGGTAVTPGLGPIVWCATAATMQAAVNSLESQYGYGQVTVTRTRAPAAGVGPGGSSIWTGGYSWLVTFRGLAEDVPPMLMDVTALTDTAGVVGLGTAQSSEVRAGSRGAEVSDVQLIDCICTACTTPASQYIRLGWGKQVSDPIPYDATTSTLRAALRAFTGLQDVIVNRHGPGGTTPTPMCSASGVTTAITFAWSAGRVPPLRIATSPIQDGNMLPAAASTVKIQYGRGWGLHGGRARQGTRVAQTCSGRGKCNIFDATCGCYAGWSDSDGGLPPESPPQAATAVGVDGADAAGNCGFFAGGLAAVAACPSGNPPAVCSGHGACSGAPEWKCSCAQGFTGPGCDQLQCDLNAAWWSIPLPANKDDNGLVESGPAADPPTFTAVSAHRPDRCSAAGRCGFTSGECTCRNGWGGPECGLIVCPGQFARPGMSVDDTCLFATPCVGLNTTAVQYPLDLDTGGLQAAGTPDPTGNEAHIYTGQWDAFGLVRGCQCEAVPPVFAPPFALNFAYRSGYACQELSCPGGPDPQDPRAYDGIDDSWEVQTLQCTLDSQAGPLAARGRITFAWRNVSSVTGIRLDAFVYDKDRPGDPTVQDRASLEQSLSRIAGFSPFSLQVINSPTPDRPQFCDPAGQTVVRVTLVAHHGDQPIISIVADTQALTGAQPGLVPVQAVEVRKGQGRFPGDRWHECNRRGVCNRLTGQCVCQPGYGSSDGYGNRGQLGDCGYYTLAKQPDSEVDDNRVFEPEL